MNIESTRKDIPDQEGGFWNGTKRWGSEHPRISRVLSIALVLLAIALVIWIFYPAQQRRFGPPGGPLPSRLASPRRLTAPSTLP